MISSVSIIIPAYNEENRLPHSLKIIADFFHGKPFNYEIIVVDDGSSDGTYSVAEKFAATNSKIQPHRLQKNSGKGAALAAGVARAACEWVLIYDADSATPIGELLNFIKAAPLPNQILIGSRAVGSSKILCHQPLSRRVLGKGFATIRKLLVGLPDIEDTQCGFKLFHQTVAQSLFSTLKTPGFLFDVEVLGKARALGLQIQEIGVQWSDVPFSKVRVSKELFQTLKNLLEIRRLLKS
ncbi:MAG: glycosyltransferase [bacterium]